MILTVESSNKEGSIKKRRRILPARKRQRRSHERRKIINVDKEDLILHSWLARIPFIILAWELGFIASFFFWLGLALQDPIFAEWPYTLITFEITGSFALALIAAARNYVVERIAKRGFAFSFWV